MIDFYCIHKEADTATQELLKDAVESGEQFGIEVTPFPGVYDNVNEKMKTENLFINPAGARKIKNKGVVGCFLSHYALWKKCAERNEPIGVLEYDAIFINRLPADVTDKFDDCLHLDYTRHTHLFLSNKQYITEISNTKDNPFTITAFEKRTVKEDNTLEYITGTFGYIIKPSGARKLINATKEYGILPADMQLNLQYVNMYYTSPSTMMLNPIDIRNMFRRSHTMNGRLTT